LATVLATFQKIGQFFPNHLVTLTGRVSNDRRERNKKNFLGFSLIFG
jgi:hypothetical protein